MKKLLKTIPLWGMAMLLFACQEEIKPIKGEEAIITGYNALRCMCCGGYMITLSGDETPFAEPYFQWQPGPEHEDLDLDNNLPLHVKINYTLDPDRCTISEGWIEVSKIKVIDK